jgi:hypothetical protein
MKRIVGNWIGAALVLAVVAVTVIGFGALAISSASAEKAGSGMRIGTYESRAVAIAFARSSFMPVAEKRREYQEAKAAGDTEKIKELEEWFPAYQRQLHRQGFGRVPVDDILEYVKDRLPEVASAMGVDAIVFDCNYASDQVEVVDVTMALVGLFNPDEKTLKILDEIKNHAPVDLDDLAEHEDH